MSFPASFVANLKMERTTCPLSKLIILTNFLFLFGAASAVNYNVKIGSQCIHTVEKNFMSFTVDPKHVFSSVEMFHNMESNCMASFLTPAYLRIAGPSTRHVSFKNSSSTIVNKRPRIKKQLSNFRKHIRRNATKPIEITERQWTKFVKWANVTGFDIVFALNNMEKASDLWNLESAAAFLSMANKTNIGDLFWQLGYECKGQSVDGYLKDLEALRSIVEKFTPKPSKWRVVAGDVSDCISPGTDDFTDYVNTSVNITDALMLNGNSSYYELARLSPADHLELINVIQSSNKPVWLTETSQDAYSEMERAADWLTSLGYSARSGFHVHFRELMEEQLYEPSLSFYMALLFKNLVGECVLPVDNMSHSNQPDLFAHCTSLRHAPIQGAVTLYGANMNEEPAKMLLKISDQEDGGELMKFILKTDSNGNIIVNGQEMTYEGDIRPMVKRIQPYKTLVLNLPPRSFGFWVLANTSIEACRGTDVTGPTVSEKDIINNIENTERRKKRYIDNDLVKDLRNDLQNHIKIFKDFGNQSKSRLLKKVKRHIREEKKQRNKNRRHLLNARKEATVLDIVKNVLNQHKLRNFLRFNKNKSLINTDVYSELIQKKASRAKRHILNMDDVQTSSSDRDALSTTENTIKDVHVESEKNNSLFPDITSRFHDNKGDDFNEPEIKIDLHNESITFKIKSLLDSAIAKEAAKAIRYLSEKMKELAQKAGMNE